MIDAREVHQAPANIREWLMNVTQGLRRVLQTNPEGIATIDGDRRRSWREIGERVARLAGGLQGLGVKRGDRVAVLMLNSDRYLELYLGIAWAGAVIVPPTSAGATPRSRTRCATAAPRRLSWTRRSLRWASNWQKPFRLS
jgi:acyl-CoA synthetase (AMP-forming)/AMP-acid ligase II